MGPLVASSTPTVVSAVPTGGLDGQESLFEIQMTNATAGANRTITMNASYDLGQNVTSRSIVVPTQNDWAYIRMINRSGTYRLLAVDTGA